jgi:CheY-like chemotaxis protein
VRVAVAAQQTVDILSALDSEVSAFVTDLHLPTMDGSELIERIRAERGTWLLPIIVINGDTDPRTCALVLSPARNHGSAP